MARERIDNMGEARHLRHEHRPQSVAYFSPDISAVPVAQHGVSGVGMDGIEVDFAALRDAEGRLATLNDQLSDQLNSAAHLTGPLADGTSPVTGPMRKLFHSRADMEGGVQTALLEYLEELTAVQLAIRETLEEYEGVDEEAASRLRHQVARLQEVD
jgi:hypothetical protein